MTRYKPSLKKKMTSILGLVAIVIGILAGLAEVTGWSFRDFFSGTDAQTETLTVLTHGKRGLDDILIPNRGEVALLYGTAKYVRQINDQGEAIFQEIPDAYFAKGEAVKLLFTDPEGEPYRASYPDSAYQLQMGKAVELLVTLEGMDEINGVIKDFVTGDYIANARIRFENGCVANITASRVSNKRFRRFRVFGPEGYYGINLMDQELDIVTKGETPEGRQFPELEVDHVSFDAEQPLQVELAHFAEVAQGQAMPLVTGLQGLRALQLAEQIQSILREYGAQE